MKNNKILSLGLFREGRSQLRAIGIAYICVCAIMAVFCGLYYIDDAIIDSYASYSVLSPYSGSIAIAAEIGIFIVLPVMTLMIFNFLNSRSAADYYHSIPKSRIQLVLSFSLAVAFWIFLGIAAAAVTEFDIGLICGMNIAWKKMGMCFVNLLTLYIQVYGIMLLAVSIATGILNQIAAVGIIAFLPRIMLVIMGQISEDSAPVLMGLNDVLGKFGEVEINLLFNNAIFTGLDPLENESLITVIYSLILGIIYGALGIVCFCRRKSEAATAAGANKYVQCGIRVLVAFVVCLIPCGTIGRILIGAESAADLLAELIESIPMMFIFYGMAVVAYFLYEAITAKKIKGVVTFKGTMGIGLLALFVLNVTFIVAPTVIANISLAANINTKNVESVSLYSSDGTYYETSYHLIGIDEIEFEDKEIIETLCESLERDIEVIKAGNYNNYFYRENMARMEITFNMKDGRKLDRRVYMHLDDYYAINEKMTTDDAYYELLRAVPAVEELDECYNNTYGFNDKELNALYKSLYDELNAMEDEDYFFYTTPGNGDEEKYNMYYGTVIDHINTSGIKKRIKWHNSYAINSFVPETFELYIDMVKENNKNKGDEIAELFRNSEEANIEITVFDVDAYETFAGNHSYSITFTEESPNEKEIEVMEYIGEHWDDEVDTNDVICMVDYFIDDYDLNSSSDSEYTWVSGVQFFSGEKIAEIIRELE